MKSPRRRGIWLIALLSVFFLPIIFYAVDGGRDYTSVIDRIVGITGSQTAGLLVYTACIGSRFKSKTSEFGVPLHRWLSIGVVLSTLIHLGFVLLSNPENVRLLEFWGAPARGSAATAALICMSLTLALGEFRRHTKLTAAKWRILHVALAWMSMIFALSHILWIDQLVNNPLYLLLFGGIIVAAIFMWLTRAKGVKNTTSGAVPKFVRIILIVSAVLTVGASFFSWQSPESLTVGYSQNELGPVGPADRDMLYKVKQAGLWEIPVCQEAHGRAVTSEFRDVAESMHAEHVELNQRVDDVAFQLAVQLPNDPSPDQQRWMAQISASSSGDYDRTAVQLLREAHGKVLPVLAQVRAGTRNAVIRSFAEEAMGYVTRHIGYLDSTGLVNFSALPEPPAPSTYQQPAEASYWDRDIRTIIIAGMVMAVVGVLVTMLVMSLLKAHPSTRTPAPTSVTESGRHRAVKAKK